MLPARRSRGVRSHAIAHNERGLNADLGQKEIEFSPLSSRPPHLGALGIFGPFSPEKPLRGRIGRPEQWLRPAARATGCGARRVTSSPSSSTVPLVDARQVSIPLDAAGFLRTCGRKYGLRANVPALWASDQALIFLELGPVPAGTSYS